MTSQNAKTVFLAVVLLAAAFVAFAQEEAPPLPTAQSSSEVLVVGLASVAILVLTDLVKLAFERVDRPLSPMAVYALPLVFGALGTWFGSLTNVHGWQGFLGAIGANAMWQFKATAQKHRREKQWKRVVESSRRKP